MTSSAFLAGEPSEEPMASTAPTQAPPAQTDLHQAKHREGPAVASAPDLVARESAASVATGMGSLDVLMGNFVRILNSEVAFYCQLDGVGEPPELVCSWGLGAPQELLTRPREGGFVGRALGAQRAALEPLNRDEDRVLIAAADGEPLTHAVAAPVHLATGSEGALIAGFSTPPPDHALTLWAMESSAAMLALYLHQPEALDGLLATSRTDSLTGCLSYASTRYELAREINRSIRGGLSLSICFIDLDRFKVVNDQHGHLRGNQVLAEVAHILRHGVRSCDTVGRFGGDEFVAILPQTDEADALQLAERLRSLIGAESVSESEPPLTASIGVAVWKPRTTAAELLDQADTAMLLAKTQAAGVVAASAMRAVG
jgi:diguanylate cyclase (GGDEF)-like protein